ncbi:hypothetical protein M4V62_10475 [Streptomyces durmitorensis]|uniref:Uncharacterized protein n=1 Tax=Streptomyces durmitorensis TaxID=319947 RepID=A0ABY4PQU1_9ACTN|nr:hypothetical protein [Streptomyces durmitorensis]UQT55480.1 hypothetical protein M4V62_10475 [Streptomyces durmitorensis]
MSASRVLAVAGAGPVGPPHAGPARGEWGGRHGSLPCGERPTGGGR